jgi:hypothetical protein
LLDEESEIMNSFARFAVAVIAIASLLLPPDAHAARKGKELLQYIPADTPYVFAMTKPLPQHLQDRFEPAIDKTLSVYRQIFAHHLNAEVERLRASEDGEAQAAQLQALVDEVTSLLSVR